MQPSDAELQVEAEWIFERLRVHPTLRVDENGKTEFQYKFDRKFAGNPELVREKIKNVLRMLRT